MRKPVILITGASGELGHGLIGYFADNAELPIVSLDLEPVDPSIGCSRTRPNSRGTSQ